METPSSVRRVTRSQTSSFSQKKTNKEEESTRGALQDISNDSPINGVATEKTPLSSVIKNGVLPKKTPGSGEALLRGQVRILLEKVEEEAEFVNKLSNKHCGPFLPFLGILPISPGLLANPTPANTPQTSANLRAKYEHDFAIESVPMVLPKYEESLDQQPCVINRVLLFDSQSNSEASDFSSNISSSVAYQGSIADSSYEDNSSNWSIQANAGSHEHSDKDYYEENEEVEGGLNELCIEFGKITVGDKDVKKKMSEFQGKHTRFVYNSDSEIERDEEIGRTCSDGKALSPSIVLLKGLPLPKGKHLRFHEEDDEE